MKQFFIFLLFFSTLSCSDGNQAEPEFNFSNVAINDCGELVLFKINENETLIIELSGLNVNNTFLTQVHENENFSLSENGSNKITYRVFDDKPTATYFCQNIPPTTPLVLNEWLGSGNLVVNTIMTEDDNDTVIEDVNSSLDTDGDSFLNFKDWDDDNDGILTKDEDPNGDNDPTNDDTDGDGIANYLDNDDDGDGIPSIDESTVNDEDSDGIVDYLDADTVAINSRILGSNQYQEIFNTTLIIKLLKLTNVNENIIQFDSFDYGTTTKIKTITE